MNKNKGNRISHGGGLLGTGYGSNGRCTRWRRSLHRRLGWVGWLAWWGWDHGHEHDNNGTYGGQLGDVTLLALGGGWASYPFPFGSWPQRRPTTNPTAKSERIVCIGMECAECLNYFFVFTCSFFLEIVLTVLTVFILFATTIPTKPSHHTGSRINAQFLGGKEESLAAALASWTATAGELRYAGQRHRERPKRRRTSSTCRVKGRLLVLSLLLLSSYVTNPSSVRAPLFSQGSLPTNHTMPISRHIPLEASRA